MPRYSYIGDLAFLRPEAAKRLAVRKLREVGTIGAVASSLRVSKKTLRQRGLLPALLEEAARMRIQRGRCPTGGRT